MISFYHVRSLLQLVLMNKHSGILLILENKIHDLKFLLSPGVMKLWAGDEVLERKTFLLSTPLRLKGIPE